jgi:hypothetical protein
MARLEINSGGEVLCDKLCELENDGGSTTSQIKRKLEYENECNDGTA